MINWLKIFYYSCRNRGYQLISKEELAKMGDSNYSVGYTQGYNHSYKEGYKHGFIAATEASIRFNNLSTDELEEIKKQLVEEQIKILKNEISR